MRVAETVFGPQIASIDRYVDILASRGVDWGLIGPREVDRLWERHILNSVALTDLIPAGSRVIDVGSGAGLPGIPLAILRPDLEITLLEPLLRRSTFLNQTVQELGISAVVRVVRGRAEDHAESYDVVLARAVAPLDRLIDWCEPLRSPTGSILALKGQAALDEIRAAAPTLRSRHLVARLLSARADPAANPATVVQIRRA